METKNRVILLGYYGGDERHCISAWQSTNIELGIELPIDINERIHRLYEETVIHKKKSPEELLLMLAQHGHTSPFRKSYLDFQITADIASHIHSIKHRVGVEVNSESSRYKELKDKYYVPPDWLGLKADNEGLYEAGLGQYKDLTWAEILKEHSEQGNALYHECIRQLEKSLGRKRAKESARYFLSYNKQLDYDMQLSFQAFINFLNLRMHQAAQVEIQAIAQRMLQLVRDIPDNPFEFSLKAFGY